MDYQKGTNVLMETVTSLRTTNTNTANPSTLLTEISLN